MFKIKIIKADETYGSFVAEPLDRGFGITLGNALRRVLLSSIPGIAITWVKIDGILHEFSPIPHIKEDVQELLLNIKQLNLCSPVTKAATLYLETEKEGKLFARDLKAPPEIEIINPDLYLATVDSNEAKLSVELNAEYGTGYLLAKHVDNQPLGVILVDALFSPIRKVNYSISTIRAGLESNMDSLALEVWTNGSLSPAKAVIKAASILIENITPFQALGQTIEKKVELVRLSVPPDQYNMPVEKMGLSVRALNSLKRASINTVGELLERLSEGKVTLKGFGQKSEELVNEKLKEMGLFSLLKGMKEGTGEELSGEASGGEKEEIGEESGENNEEPK